MDKFYGYDLKQLNADDLETIEECAYAMVELDKMIINIKDQLGRAYDDLRDRGVYADDKWYRSARTSLTTAQLSRVIAQEKRGVLKREIQREKSQKSECLFIEAAKQILSKEQIAAIWEKSKGMQNEKEEKTAQS